MAYHDVFNGDADGICALHQLRLAEPQPSVLVTGTKREISLLCRVDAQPQDQVTVLDVSLDQNREALERLLLDGVRVRYFDHHFAGPLPANENLLACIDTASDTCTSLLVNAALGGQFLIWAVVGAFGDNLDNSARSAAEPLELGHDALEQLRELGILLNYNAYGASTADLHIAPDTLFRRLQPYQDPFAFIAEDDAFARLRTGYNQDMGQASSLLPEVEEHSHAVYILPALPWARRIGGVFANRLTHSAPQRAHALLTCLPGGGYLVSVRAPLNDKRGADTLCRQFATGGGRRGAAGINCLPEEHLGDFVAKFKSAYS
jgi:hypothetical protein